LSANWLLPGLLHFSELLVVVSLLPQVFQSVTQDVNLLVVRLVRPLSVQMELLNVQESSHFVVFLFSLEALNHVHLEVGVIE
jgi:hypothetical protein